jgi:hypothetical protein
MGCLELPRFPVVVVAAASSHATIEQAKFRMNQENSNASENSTFVTNDPEILEGRSFRQPVESD